ncbi:archaeosortase/exosortase family protein, partial [Arthrospira platensis SPKY1]|nr:archaeosortase/exosortase family protein [Arthrospira platensis SPKY1]
AWFTAFGAFVVLALLLPALDWPLRGLAGAWGAWALGLLGQQHELQLISHEGVPMLLLIVNNQPFHVAPECNGFGVMTSSLLLALLLSIQRVLPVLDKALTLIGALVLAFAANILRIIII